MITFSNMWDKLFDRTFWRWKPAVEDLKTYIECINLVHGSWHTCANKIRDREKRERCSWPIFFALSYGDHEHVEALVKGGHPLNVMSYCNESILSLCPNFDVYKVLKTAGLVITHAEIPIAMTSSSDAEWIMQYLEDVGATEQAIADIVMFLLNRYSKNDIEILSVLLSKYRYPSGVVYQERVWKYALVFPCNVNLFSRVMFLGVLLLEDQEVIDKFQEFRDTLILSRGFAVDIFAVFVQYQSFAEALVASGALYLD